MRKNANAPLIRVELNNEGQQVVSARDLYTFLEIGDQFTDWCKRMFEYGFVENRDYVLLQENLKQKGRGGHNKIDYALTLDCAKHIAMVQRTDKGMQARQYFIDCETRLKQVEQVVTETRENILDNVLAQFNTMQARQDALEARQAIFSQLQEALMQDLSQAFKECKAGDSFARFNINLLQKAIITACRDIKDLQAQISFNNHWVADLDAMVQEMMRFYGLEANFFVYVFLNPKNGLYKIGKSGSVAERKKQLETVQNGLQLMFAIPTMSTGEATSLEKTLQKRFTKRLSFGEWYALQDIDLQYLRAMQEANRNHIVEIGI